MDHSYNFVSGMYRSIPVGRRGGGDIGKRCLLKVVSYVLEGGSG